jgi:hypothetical protein
MARPGFPAKSQTDPLADKYIATPIDQARGVYARDITGMPSCLSLRLL